MALSEVVPRTRPRPGPPQAPDGAGGRGRAPGGARTLARLGVARPVAAAGARPTPVSPPVVRARRAPAAPDPPGAKGRAPTAPAPRGRTPCLDHPPWWACAAVPGRAGRPRAGARPRRAERALA